MIGINIYIKFPDLNHSSVANTLLGIDMDYLTNLQLSGCINKMLYWHSVLRVFDPLAVGLLGGSA